MALRRGLRVALPLRARTSAPPASLRDGPQAPRRGGYEVKIRGQVGGAVPRLNALIVEEEGLETAPLQHAWKRRERPLSLAISTPTRRSRTSPSRWISP